MAFPYLSRHWEAVFEQMDRTSGSALHRVASAVVGFAFWDGRGAGNVLQVTALVTASQRRSNGRPVVESCGARAGHYGGELQNRSREDVHHVLFQW